MAKAISFNGNDLQTDNILTADIEHVGGPDVDALAAVLANANKSAVDSLYYPSKTIIVTGRIIGSSISDCESRIDTFKGYFAGVKEKNLDIGYAGSTRRYIATPTTKVEIDQPGGLAYAIFKIEFACSLPFGKATSDSTIVSDTARTDGNYSDNHTFLGTAPMQLPVITITVNSVTDGENTYVLLGNNATGQQIIISRTWAAGDVLEVDCYNRTVKVNGIDVSFAGGFPQFETGSQYLDYADGFSARNFDISAIYTPLYM